MSEDLTDVDSVISEIDSFLAEEDPDFLKELNSIKIDNAMVDLSLMDQALANSANGVVSARFSLVAIKPLFDIRENAKIVLPFWILIVMVGFGIFKVVNFKNWNKPDSLFLTSYSEWGLEVNTYNPFTESEMFFDNPRLLKNIVTIKKMVANIKPSESSGPNPMLAFELNIEGMTSEVVVEIKDREAEFKDLILRTAEELNYDELSGASGKKNLSERILNVINSNLTQGQIRKVLYKSFVLKI
jgi:flagellar basal body-associated protein FliL